MSHTVKTAISLDRKLFQQGEALAEDMRVSRSRLYALALEELVRRHENRQLLEQINNACQEGPDSSERALLDAMRRTQQRISEGED